MAKMWKARAVTCEREFGWNAGQILGTRVAEVFAHASRLADPLDCTGHHDLRISIKRLRYSLEFFAVCYDPADVAAILEPLSTLQDYLGDLHDADVFIPEMQRVIEGLEADGASRLRDAVAAAENRETPAPFDEFASGLEGERDVKAGVLGVVNRMRRQRRESYAAAAAMWERLESEGFRERLVRLGEPAPAPTPAPAEGVPA